MKNKFYFSIFLSFLCSISIISAQCPVGDVTLTTQAEVDNFLSTYPGCTNLTGSLTIGPSTDITNLNSLATLDQIGWSLFVSNNTALSDMSGLSNLTSVGRYLRFTNNPLLTSIDIEDVSGSIANDFIVQNNDALTTLAAPIGLVSVGHDVMVVQNPNLINLTGLENLTSVARLFRFSHILEDDFPDFSNLTSVGGDISFSNNPNVLTLNLQNVGGSLNTDFFITNNAALISLAAPINLETIGHDLLIVENPNLANLTGLENLTSVGRLFRFSKILDPVFPDFSNLTSVGGDIVFSNNPNVPFLNLPNVGGSLTTDFVINNNNSLTTLAAPEFLTSVGNNFQIDNNPNLSTITGLENLTSVGRSFIIRQTIATDFPDFSNLTNVGQNISIHSNLNVTYVNIQNVTGSLTSTISIGNNASLITLDAPINLTSVGTDVSINTNPSLVTVNGLENIETIGSTLYIYENAFVDPPDFSSITTIGKRIYIYNNPNMTSIDLHNVSGAVGAGEWNAGIAIGGNASLTLFAAPEPLTAVNGSFSIAYNPNLSTLTGFDNLTSIQKTFWLSQIPASTFPDMLNLTTIGEDLFFEYNSGVENLDWISNLVSIGNNLRLFQNPLLSNCSIDAVCNYLATPPGSTTIGGNTGCCLDKPTLIDDCNDPNIGIPEICDGIDNDCDGLIDEAGPCPTSSVTILSQQDLDDYVANYGGCNTITNSLIIGPSSDITNLDVLSCIEHIAGELRITSNSALQNINGLSNDIFIGIAIKIGSNPLLTEIDFSQAPNTNLASIVITHNTALETFLAPVAVQEISNWVQIYDNTNLATLTGFDDLNSIGAHLRINDTDASVFPDFSNLTFIGKSLTIGNNSSVNSLNFSPVVNPNMASIVITNNPFLTNLDAPTGVQDVSNWIHIYGNTNLATMTGFDDLSSTGNLRIQDTDIAIFPNLSNLTTIVGELRIQTNSLVSNLNWLSNLTTIGTQLKINNNPLLSNCTIDVVCNYLANPPGTVSVYGNTGCCLDEAVLSVACDNQSSGNSEICDGLDNDCDGLIDEGFDQDGDGFTTCQGDCDDTNAAINPDAIEICDGQDNNCDNVVDEGFDLDGDGVTTCAGDCDDNDPNNYPGNIEVCDGQDNNCDNVVDEGFDLDGDGVTSCAGDCDDNDPNNYPGNIEVCDGQDNNCDNVVDEGFDVDGDGFTTCAGDCDDNDPNNYPGNTEVCDGQDNNCDNVVDEGFDLDGDGVTTCGGDCDDNDPNNYPGNTEVCDGQDNNCDDIVDEGFDQDNDGVADCFDNCPDEPNPGQDDEDCDGVGDVCDQWPGCDDTLDSDNDGIPNCVDLDETANWPCGNNGNKVTVCHIPPGNPANRHDICVSENAVPAHLNNHGDYIGECDQIICDGNRIGSFKETDPMSFELFPNPTSNSINLDLSHYKWQMVSITVSNTVGQKLLSLPEQELVYDFITLDLPAHKFPSGIYFITVKSEHGNKTKQFLISHL